MVDNLLCGVCRHAPHSAGVCRGVDNIDPGFYCPCSEDSIHNLGDWMGLPCGEAVYKDIRDLVHLIQRHKMNTRKIDDKVTELLIEFGPDGHCDGHEKITEYVVSLVTPLEMLLRESKREHGRDDDDDPCEKINYLDGEHACTCGADAWNARIDAVLGQTPVTP